MIQYRHGDGVARITLDTPETSNRFTYQLMLDYIAALEQARDSGARILVIEATGEHFTLGRDQKEIRPDIPKRDNLGLILRANATLRTFPGVSLSLVNGRAMGFGTGISLHATISVAAHDALLGFDEIHHGLAPLVVQVYLPHFIPPRVATELIVTGRDVPAEEALQIGLVSRVAPPGRLAETGEEIVSQILGNSPAALRLIHTFGRDIDAYPPADVSLEAVERLVAWIEAGKP